MQRVLAIGGGGYLMEEGPSLIDHFILNLIHKPKLRTCYVDTPDLHSANCADVDSGKPFIFHQAAL